MGQTSLNLYVKCCSCDSFYLFDHGFHEDTFSQIFSFVFGDGDPNEEIEEERWKLVILEH